MADSEIKSIAVIGGGAAGFFAAISAKAHHPDAKVTLFEQSGKILAKVKVSGGGRCNVTHNCFSIGDMVKAYPRGGKQLKKVFGTFFTKDTIEWFESRGVKIKAEADGRMFPVSDSSQSIIDCLSAEANKNGVTVKLKSPVQAIKPTEHGFEMTLGREKIQSEKVIIASGGSPTLKGLKWLADLGHEIKNPVPSLFTFNMPKESVKSLMGVVAPKAAVKIEGSKLKAEGPLLITHWGMSGPAILKLSAWGARELADKNYTFTILTDWTGGAKEEELRARLEKIEMINPKKKMTNLCPIDIPTRLWNFLLEKSELGHEKPWGELGKKNRNRLINTLLNDRYQVSGKTTFKEEFVTCGGVALADVDFTTMQSKKVPGMYFAGEVLDIDGITGGFNFQAAWSTGFVAGMCEENL
jgi:predicted Rossmann fold flavoprotein